MILVNLERRQESINHICGGHCLDRYIDQIKQNYEYNWCLKDILSVAHLLSSPSKSGIWPSGPHASFSLPRLAIASLVTTVKLSMFSSTIFGRNILGDTLYRTLCHSSPSLNDLQTDYSQTSFKQPLIKQYPLLPFLSLYCPYYFQVATESLAFLLEKTMADNW